MKNQISRRKFIVQASATSVLTASALETFIPEKKEIFVHHVYFWLKNPGNEADRSKLIEGLETLKKIPTIKTFHIGVPATTNRDVIDRSYAVSELMIFDNLEDEEVYQNHPIHKKFIENYSHLWEKVIVYDSVTPKK